MSLTFAETPAARAREWRLTEIRAVCDVLEPWPFGLLMKATRHPTYFLFNAVLVQREPGLTAQGLMALADRHLAGSRHRCIEFSRAEHGLGLREAFRSRGWHSALEVWMRLAAPGPGPAPGADVVRVPYEAVSELRRLWHGEELPGLEIGEHLADAAEVAGRRQPQVLAVRRRGRPIAYAQVEREGDAAEVTEVYVHPDHRGGGIGTAMTRAAIQLAPPVRDLWIKADAEGRPQRLYARLGFQSVAQDLKFLRLPPGS